MSRSVIRERNLPETIPNCTAEMSLSIATDAVGKCFLILSFFLSRRFGFIVDLLFNVLFILILSIVHPFTQLEKRK